MHIEGLVNLDDMEHILRTDKQGREADGRWEEICLEVAGPVATASAL